MDDEYQVDVSKCQECAGSVMENVETGEMECQACGLVAGQAIDMGKDYRSFADGSGDSERHGMKKTYLIHDGGLSTDISAGYKDAQGKTITGDFRKRLYRLRRHHQRSRVQKSSERNMVQALYELQRLASHMGLSESVREQAAFIYKKAAEKKLVQGRSIEGVVAASIHAACRDNGIHRTLDEIGRHSRIGRKEIGRTYRKVKQDLGLKIRPAQPTGFVSSFCSKLQVPVTIESEAFSLLEDPRIRRVAAGRSPTGIAAAVVYLACMKYPENYRTQRDVAQAAGVTEVTIRNRYNEICDVLGLDRRVLGKQ